MLRVPQVMFYQDPVDGESSAVVYGDDEDPAVFYAIPGVPTIRRDGEGNPVFKLIKYAFDNDALVEDAGMPAGGGYLQMDVALELPTEVRDRLLEALVPLVPRPEDPQDPPRTPRLASPDYADATVRFFSVQDPNLVVGGGVAAGDPERPTETGETVRGHLAEGKPNMMGANISGLSATLTPAGATFFQRTLVGVDGEPVEGLLPIRIEYDLTFKARLPPVTAFVHAEKSAFHREFESVRHNFEGRGCDEDRRRTTENYWSVLSQARSVQMDFDIGELPSDDPAVMEMRTFVMTQVSEWTQQVVLEKVEADDPGFPDIDKIYQRSDDVYRYRSTVNSQSADLHIDIKQRSIGTRRLHPNASLRPIFGDLTPEEMRRFVQEIDLSDDFFQKVVVLPIVRVDWQRDPIQRVTLVVAYGDEEFEFDFSKDEEVTRGRAVFSRIEGRRDYRYRYLIEYDDPRAEVFESDWTDSRVVDLDVIPAERGLLPVGISVASFNDGVLSLRLELVYRSASGEEFRDVRDYTADADETWDVRVLGPADGRLTATATWTLQDGSQVEAPVEVGDDFRVVVLPPQLPTIQCVVLVPDSDAINQLFVTVRPALLSLDVEQTYERRPGAENTATLIQHQFFVPEGTPRQWQYRYTIDPAGDLAPAQTGPGSGNGWSDPLDSGETAEVRWDSSLAEVSKQVIFSAARLVGHDLIAVTVVARHTRPDGQSLRFDHTFRFSGDAPPGDATWEVTLLGREWDGFTYEWEATYFPASGGDTQQSGTATSLFQLLPGPGQG